MQALNTEYSKPETSEKSYLLVDDPVKPLAKKSFSWLRCLCWTSAIVLGFLILAFALAAMGSYIWARHQVRRFTIESTEAHLPRPPLPIAPIPPAELDVFKDECKLFFDQLRAGMKPQHDLEVTEEKLNGLIASSDYLRGHAYIEMSEGMVSARLALPADQLPGGKDRFFVGEGKITLDPNDSSSERNAINMDIQLLSDYPIRGLDFDTILDGKFDIYSDSNRIRKIMELQYGQFLNFVAPADYISKHENLLDCDSDHHGCRGRHGHGHHHRKHQGRNHQEHYNRADDECEEFMDAIGRLQSVKIEEGKMIFTPMGKAETPTEALIIEHENTVIDETNDTSEGGVRGRRALTANGKSSLIHRLLREVVMF